MIPKILYCKFTIMRCIFKLTTLFTLTFINIINCEKIYLKDCQSRLRTKRGQSFDLHESFVCAGGSKTGDTCEGDGGGPLVCPTKGSDGDRYIQVNDKLIIIMV